MATVNIGSLKFNWKGAYNGSTAYAIDDVTEYNGSSYICILASTGNLPTNTTYFQPMATKGTDGTDVGTTLTTQGDLLYRDGSGLQRLGAGTAGQVLQTGGSGANPSWGTVSSDYVLLSTTNVSGNPGSLEVDAFSNTYSIYKIFVTSARCSTTAYLRWRFRAGGSDITNSDYLSHGHQAYWNNSANGDGVHNETWNGDYAQLVSHQTSGSGYSLNSEITVFGTRDTTSFPSFHQISSTYDDSNYQRHMRSMGMNRNSASTLIDGFKLYYASGTIANMQVKVYGLK